MSAEAAAVLRSALTSVADWQVLLVIVASAVYGIFVGAVPGLTATMAVALLVPLTFYMSDVQAIAAIVTTATCSIFAGDIPAALIRIPGTPASAAYASDAYALNRQGRLVSALGTSLYFSVLGGLFGTIVLASAAPWLAGLATQFTSYEYFWLFVLGLTCAVIVSDESRLHGALSLLIGLLLSTVGLGTDFSAPRLTFGFNELVAGISFIPAMIGLFGISEVLRNAMRLNPNDDLSSIPDGEPCTFVSMARTALPFAWQRKAGLFRSSVIGSIVGMLPGAGADIAAWIAYAVSKRFARNPETFGKGSLEGLGDATGANNAALGGAWIPALVFGIPGDSVTAIALGVLMMKNITTGPRIFDVAANPRQATLVASICITFVVANLVLIPIGYAAIRSGSLLVRVPRRVLLPIIVLFCIIGSYSMSASRFDVAVMLMMGLLGFFLEAYRFPLGPVVLGLIMGGQIEHRFLQCLTRSSDPRAFFTSPVSIVLGSTCILLWIVPAMISRRRKRPESLDGG